MSVCVCMNESKIKLLKKKKNSKADNRKTNSFTTEKTPQQNAHIKRNIIIKRKNMSKETGIKSSYFFSLFFLFLFFFFFKNIRKR